jgi:SAM-dependent methyltransferase
MGELLDNDALERSSIVANASMNRERGLVGSNSYTKDLGVNPVEWIAERLAAKRAVAWLDLCCGSGKALLEGGRRLRELGFGGGVTIVGVDLVPMFLDVPPELGFVKFVEGSVLRWRPRRKFDLITCVHGLHYVGDKLGALARAATWLAPDGLFRANLDVASVKVAGAANPAVTRELRHAGFSYDPRRRVISCRGPKVVRFPFVYEGANDAAGPNYTGQPAIDSHYAVSKTPQ